ncbi:MAG: PhoH family protein, partial [Clostridia bacterium]|nr:PhoH family protein [Clostridia bacterium]
MFGPFDANVTLIERAFAVVVRNRHGGTQSEDSLSVEGNDARGVDQAVQVLETIRTVAKQGDAVPEQSVRYIIDMVRAGEQSALSDMSDDCICVTTRGKPIKAKTVGQRRYVEAIRKNTIIFGVGPAGTGKTFLAVAMAVKALRDKQVSRIILTRPAIEAGERLGFLPGDLQSKIDPYLRPLYDALFEMMGPENYQHCVEKQTIEVAPL